MFDFSITHKAVLPIFIILSLCSTNVSAFENSPEIPFVKQWSASAHANAKAEAFRHWDKDGEVPKRCAACHSSDGFRDFIGADGSAKEIVNNPAPITSVITCTTCHSSAASELDAVTFPSGASVANAGTSAMCMVCHQGRESGPRIDGVIGKLEPDQVSDKLSFINVHYAAAAATIWGGKTKGGYEYAGNNYQGLTSHPKSFNQCVECHDPHSLEVRVETCTQCHETATSIKRLKNVRWNKTDFDGDGNVNEGISAEISTMHEKLLAAIQAYAKQQGVPIAYDSHTYPYFFADTNANSKADKEEAVNPNKYKSWTPRLLKAAYNYQFVAKDSGAYAHNPAYVMQLLHDSARDLSATTNAGAVNTVRP